MEVRGGGYDTGHYDIKHKIVTPFKILSKKPGPPPGDLAKKKITTPLDFQPYAPMMQITSHIPSFFSSRIRDIASFFVVGLEFLSLAHSSTMLSYFSSNSSLSEIKSDNRDSSSSFSADSSLVRASSFSLSLS